VKAGLVTGHRRFELVEMPEPVAGPGLAVVDVALCGICGTDLHGFLGHQPYNPAICGHEWTGTVRAIGAGVTHLEVGQPVVAAIAPACGQCPSCRAGRPAWCQAAFLGMIGRDRLAPAHGGFAPAIALDAQRLVPVHRSLTDEAAAMVEPSTVAYHAVVRTPPGAGDVVVVQGCGPIGLLTIGCARALGAGTIIGVDPVAGRQALARRVGADQAVGPDAIDGLLGAAKADLVFECAGVPATIQRAVELVRRGGTVNIVGLASGQATIDPHAWLLAEVTVVASLGYLHHEFATVIDLIADGQLEVLPLHDRTVALAEAAALFARLADDPTSATKVLVRP
jgi:(R,R)-butanediol dehydrogenase/meso-butanediol dehydrogenase/diacetyl reductase